MTGFVPVGHVVLEETSGAACAVASWDGWLHLAWTGSDTRLNVMVSADGMSFANKATLRHRSCRTESSGDSTRTVSLAPALTPSELGLIIGWTGTDHQLNILQVGAPENRNSVIPQRSAMGPALTARGSELVVGWTGTDRRLNLISAYQRGLPAATPTASRPCAPSVTSWCWPGATPTATSACKPFRQPACGDPPSACP